MLALSLFGSALLADTTAIEREFAREQIALACVSGSTDEPSCSGTDMDVYLRGDEVRKLDWWVEKSNQWVREEYFFRGTRPVLVIETIEKKYDSHAEPLPKPQLVSRTRHPLDQTAKSARIKEFLEHAEFLLRDFQNNRSSFSPCVLPHTQPIAAANRLAAVKSTFDFMKRTSMSATLVAASGGLAQSR
jgi:hypothetical protein